jgi:hypothetical protein
MAEQELPNQWQPLVEYNNKKDFVGLMETMFEKIEGLMENQKINDGEYLEFANLCRDIHKVKTEIQTQIVYVEIHRAVQRKPPKPLKEETQKLDDKNYKTCEFCNKRLHRKYMPTHLRESKTCVRARQTKLNVKVLAEQNRPQYVKFQAINLVWMRRHQFTCEAEHYQPLHRMFNIQTLTLPVVNAKGEIKYNEDTGEMLTFNRYETLEEASIRNRKELLTKIGGIENEWVWEEGKWQLKKKMIKIKRTKKAPANLIIEDEDEN